MYIMKIWNKLQDKYDMINFNTDQINNLYKTFARSKNITQLVTLVNNTNNISFL